MRDRSAFGYIEPHPDDRRFAQCGTCQLWLQRINNCYWLSANDDVQRNDSCILYVPGDPIDNPDVAASGTFTKAEVGFHRGQVRCENCSAFLPEISSCDLYTKLNRAFPKLFKLKTTVKPHACCNAWD